MDSATYRHVLGQIKKSCIIPHNAFPCHNLVSTDTLVKVSEDLYNVEDDLDGVSVEDDKFLGSFPCYKSFDYNVQMVCPFYCGCGFTDVATDLVKRKLSWERKLKSIRIKNLQNAVKCIKNFQKDKSVKLTQNLKQYINHFDSDPEPNFYGSYNWLYTGGSLLAIEANDITLFGSEFINKKTGFKIITLDKNLNSIKKSVHQLKVNSPVLQISGHSQKDHTIVSIRQKNGVTLLKIDSVGGLDFPEVLWRKKVKHKILTSVDVNKTCDQIVVSDTKSDVHVFDVETKVKTIGFGSTKCKNRDAWNQVMFDNLGVYFANRDSFSVFDGRDDAGIPVLKYSPGQLTNTCEDICSISKSGNASDYIYLGTSHNLIQVDVRNQKAVQRWTHMMKNSPQFIKCVKDDNTDFIVLQSPKIIESFGVTNDCIMNGEEIDFLSKSLPCILTSANESLKLARLNGLCLSPHVASRFDFAVTGLQCLKNSEGDILTFTENSGGDIFLSKFRKKSIEQLGTEEAKTEILKQMKIYESHFENFLPLDTRLTQTAELINMSHVLNDLKRTKVKYPIPAKAFHWKYNEMFAFESLAYYKDVLAEKIRKVWHLPEVEESHEMPISAEEKVWEWIKKIED